MVWCAIKFAGFMKLVHMIGTFNSWIYHWQI